MVAEKRGDWNRPCTTCGVGPPLRAFGTETRGNNVYRLACCLKCGAKHKKLRKSKNHATVVKARLRSYTYRYGHSREELELLLADQHHGCAICDTDIHFSFDAPYRPGNRKHNSTARVDHCHDSKVVRGILCIRCNAGLGHFRDDVELMKLAIEYLDEFES